MSSALKQVIVNAIAKVSTDPVYAGREYANPEEARHDFTKALIEVLFPENPSVPAVKEKKKPGPKPKLDENGQPIKKAKSPKTPVSPDSLEAPAEASPKKERKPRAPMTEEQKAAMVAKRKATMEAKKEAGASAPASPATVEPEKTAKRKANRKATIEANAAAELTTPKKEEEAPASPPKAPKKAKKEPEPEPEKSPKKAKKAVAPPPLPASPPKAPAPAPSSTVNVDKFTPTHKRWMKEVGEELKVEIDKKDVLSYLNGLSNAAFHDKPLRDHIREYAMTLVQPEEETQQKEEVELIEQEFDGETYYVNPETKRVYTLDDQGNTTPVGYVGMAKFADMEIDEDEE